MYKKILVPLDGSKRAESILSHVEGLARCLDAEVILLRVFKTDFSQVDYFGHDSEFYEAIRAECKEEIQAYLTEVQELRQSAGQLWVIEQRPAEGEYPAEAAGDLIPQADVVALTGSSLINHTLDHLLAMCRPDVPVMVLGPSTPLSPVLFTHGVSLLSGTRVMDEDAVLHTVAQGSVFQQVEGVRLLTIARQETK